MRTAIFIDGAYLEFTLRESYESVRIDYGLLSEKMAGGIDVLRSYYYNCLPYVGNPPTEEEKTRLADKQRFFDALTRIPRYQVRLGQLAFRGLRTGDNRPIFEQKRVDTLMAVDFVLLCSTQRITHAALLTGDGDFVPAVNVAKEFGVVVSLWYSDRFRADDELWRVCDERHVIDQQLIDSIRLRSYSNGETARVGRSDSSF
jgi:uncharacterized LabA/DUF88 family protein